MPLEVKQCIISNFMISGYLPESFWITWVTYFWNEPLFINRDHTLATKHSGNFQKWPGSPLDFIVVVIIFVVFLYWTNWEWCRTFRSRYRSCCKNFIKFTEKHLFRNLFFNKVASLRPAALFKKRLRHFLWIFAKLLRTRFPKNTFRRLILKIKCWGCTYW